MTVKALLNSGAPEKPTIALTYAMNEKRDPQMNGGSEEMRVKVKHRNCVSDVNEEIVDYKTTVFKDKDSSSDKIWLWDVELAMDTSKVMGDSTLVSGSANDFTVLMCIRTEMWNKEGSSDAMISYDETNVEVDVVLATDFKDYKIEARADEKRGVGGSADIEYKVKTCLCNDNFDCVNEQRHPNQMIRICTETDDDRVEMEDIRLMELYQGGDWKHTAVKDRKKDALTSVEKFNFQKDGRQITVVETTALPVFFDRQSDPKEIEVRGTALMRFYGSRQRQLRRLEDDPSIAAEEDFSLKIELDPTLVDASATAFKSGLALLLSCAALLWLL
ncbi:MAG: hypothetical protein SGILL_002985 [Bacillariaceae sp.]